MTGRATILTTDRLRLTTWLPGDLAQLHALHADPRPMRYLTSGVQTEQQSRGRLATWLGEQATREWSKWRVEDQRGALAGRAGFGRAHDTRYRELGFLLAPSLWGAGYATELATGLVAWHHRHPDPTLDPALRGYVLVENHASRRVLVKTGFHSVGHDDQDARQLVFETSPT